MKAFLLGFALTATLQSADIAAGVSRVDISPPAGHAMAGYGARKQLSTGVHDPLYATVLVLKTAGQSIAIVTADLHSGHSARLESEALDSSFVGDSHEKIEPPKPRHFVLDKPFLLYVKEKKADVPYLVLWVANGEIMQKFEQSTRHP